ncbi:MAG: FAD-binding protein [Planctomycetota bacterium]
MTPETVSTPAELGERLRAHAAAGRRVRLLGRGTRGRLLAPPPADAVGVSVAALSAIERLEPDDLTCSVQPGVTCAALAAALAETGLELGGLDGGDPGTIGGLLAADPLPLASPGAPCPRAALLGLDAILADGTSFRSGSRVVKSVAGFDVHRPFVGSRGRLFAAVLLHLKLRAAPRVRVAFAAAPDAPDAQLRRFLALRRLPEPPRRLVLRRADGGALALDGELGGRPAQVEATLQAHGLGPATRGADHVTPPPEHELVVGAVRVSRAAQLLASLPAAAPFALHAGGHFECALRPADGDALLRALPALDAWGAIALGDAARVGRGTPLDPGAARLEQALRRALDPGEVLA